MKHDSFKRDGCAVYFLPPEMTQAQAKERYERWVQTEGKIRRKALPDPVRDACQDVADMLQAKSGEELVDQAMRRLREAIGRTMT